MTTQQAVEKTKERIQEAIGVYQQRCRDYDNDMAMANVPTPDECLVEELSSLIDEEKLIASPSKKSSLEEKRTIAGLKQEYFTKGYDKGYVVGMKEGKKQLLEELYKAYTNSQEK